MEFQKKREELQKTADVLFPDKGCGSAVISMASLSSNSQRERDLALSAKASSNAGKH